MTDAPLTDEEIERKTNDVRAMLERVRQARNKKGENLTFDQMLIEMGNVMVRQKMSVLDVEALEKALTQESAEVAVDEGSATKKPQR